MLDWGRIKHMLFLKSTWAIIFSNLGIILNTSGLLNDTFLENYTTIVNCLLAIAEGIGFYQVYITQPKEESK